MFLNGAPSCDNGDRFLLLSAAKTPTPRHPSRLCALLLRYTNEPPLPVPVPVVVPLSVTVAVVEAAAAAARVAVV